MNFAAIPPPVPLSDVARKKARAAEIVQRARTLFDAGTPGIQIAAATCEAADRLLLDFIQESLSHRDPAEQEAIPRNAAVIAVGGTGRGELAPYSDIDLLFLDGGGRASKPFRECVSQIVQSCWDAKLQLGHSVRSVGECVALAKQDGEIATALVEARLLWGSRELFARLTRRFQRSAVDGRRRAFVQDCLKARAGDWPEAGVPAQQLEPDVKGSLGGLRDLHLIRWIGFGLFGAPDLDSLRLKGALSMEEVRLLRGAWEFLTRVRIDLHLNAGKVQDVLTRDEQLRIAEQRGIAGSAGQRPVERFMQEYFRHSSALAKISRRFAARHSARPVAARLRTTVFSHRADGVLRVSRDEIDVAPRHLPRVCDSLEAMLRLYKAAALYGVLPSPRVTDAVEIAVRELSDDLSPVAARLFLDILRCTTSLGPTLRSMYDVGLLERIIPDMAHARCLMQFNQYHHYTVDEHTLRAVEAAAQFDAQDGPVGAACRTIRHREILHLALLLHDLGKGFEEPHSDVGRVIAERMAARLHLPRHHADQLVFLVHKHLEMSHTALRRDITDPDLLVEFCRLVGTPENLRLLYVLTAADITAVGPGAWTAWKGELLADMFDRCLVILSGKHYSYHEQERLREIKQRVVEALQGDFGFSILDSGLKDAHGGDRIENPKSKIHNQDAPITTDWVDKQLSSFSAYYLTCTSPRRIAADLQVIRRLGADEIHIAGACDAGAVEYRVITRDAAVVPGCFHKMAGVLTAKRMEILSADINTTRDGVVVDSFRILDRDYDGAPPPARIADVTAALHDVLRGTGSIESLFRRHKRFGAEVLRPPISDLRTRVEVDNDSSDSRTVIEVFAHDRPGLLYTVTRTIYELNLSVDLAKISTYYDQVLDVFYVRETSGLKVRGDERLNQVREALLATLRDFEQQGYRAFVA